MGVGLTIIEAIVIRARAAADKLHAEKQRARSHEADRRKRELLAAGELSVLAEGIDRSLAARPPGRRKGKAKGKAKIAHALHGGLSL